MTLNRSTTDPSYGSVPAPNYELVKSLDHFSSDASGQIYLDDREKKYLKMPPAGQDFRLKQGFRAALVSGALGSELEKGEGINYILDWTALKVAGVGAGDQDGTGCLKDIYGGAEVVTHYKALQQAAEASYRNPAENPYDKFQYDIVATKYKGLIYLCHFDTEAELAKKANPPESEQVMAYGNRKFERIMTSHDAAGRRSCVNEPISNLKRNLYAASLYSLGRTNWAGRFLGTKIFMACDVDCLDPVTGDKVELRTNAVFTKGSGSAKEQNFKASKSRRIWLNMHLTGATRVIFGLRDRYFVVSDLLDMKESEIPPYAAAWSPTVCMAAVDRFLGFVKKQLDGAEDLTYIRFVFGQGKGKVIRMVGADDPKYHFLNQKFLSATMDIP